MVQWDVFQVFLAYFSAGLNSCSAKHEELGTYNNVVHGIEHYLLCLSDINLENKLMLIYDGSSLVFDCAV